MADDKLMEEELWNSKLTVADMVNEMSQELREMWNALPGDTKKELIDDNSHSIQKGIHAGLMTEWPMVIMEAARESGLLNDIQRYYKETHE